MHDREIYEILDEIKFLKKMWEIIRFVNPLKKKVIRCSNDTLTELDTNALIFGRKTIFVKGGSQSVPAVL